MSGTVRTTCPYCGVGCGVLATPKPDGTVEIKGDPDHPANFGRLCSKGSALGETVDFDGRLLQPEIDGRKAGWDEALDLVANRFSDTIREHGPDSVAFYVSGQLLTEDYYVANKLMKGFIGSGNIDTNSRLCMASSVSGHRRAFGTDTVPGTYEDLELSDVLVLVGSNLAWCHPVLYQRIAAAKAKRPGMRVVLIDPRRTKTADLADLHLAIEPDSDAALFNGLLLWLAGQGYLRTGWVEAHTTGMDAALDAAAEWTLDAVSAATGLPATRIAEFYRLWSGTDKVVTAYSQGVNQSVGGTDKVNAVINCHLATARIGRPGMGPFSLTGQPNAMGGRETGGLASMLAAHMEIENPEHRDRMQRFWQSPAIAGKPGLKAVDMFQAVADGRIKALWIMATNPVVSMPEADAVEVAIRDCPFVVVSDVMAETDTLCHAHVKLPSLAWGEKDGTVTNSERRISRQRAFLPPPGEARADWWQMAEVGRRMGHGEAFGWADPGSVFGEYAALTGFENDGARDLDIGALAHLAADRYDALAPFQWPWKKGAATPGPRRFFADGGFYTPDRKARLVAVLPATVRRTAKTLRLNTGRVRDHWHTMTRTAKSVRLSAHIAEPFCEVHPADAARLGIGDAELVRLEAGGGAVIVRAFLTAAQKPGTVFVPIHWNGQTASAARVGSLVAAVTDPFSGQPALKGAEVAVGPAGFRCYGFAVTRTKPLTNAFDYWALARTDGGWRLEFALYERPEDMVDLQRAICGDAAETEILAAEGGTHIFWRQAAFARERLAAAIYLATGPVEVSRSWLCDQLADRHALAGSRWRVLAGRPAGDLPDKGAIICACMGVGVNDIAGAVRGGCHSVDAVAQATTAGTNCGSCKAEITEIIKATRLVAAE